MWRSGQIKLSYSLQNGQKIKEKENVYGWRPI